MVISLGLSYIVYVTLRRDVEGPTQTYGAVFSDAYGLRDGDDVRMAGVRVGRVDSIELDGAVARVKFVLQEGQTIYGNTVAGVIYENIVGQRFLGLSRGSIGDPAPVEPGFEIPIEQTDPSFDVGAFLNGYQPLFATLDVDAAEDLTQGIIDSLKGDEGSLATLVSQTSDITETFAGRDNALGTTITKLDTVVGNLADQNEALNTNIDQVQDVVAAFNNRRPELIDSMGSISRVVSQLGSISNEVRPSLDELVQRQPGFVSHMTEIEPQLAFLGANLPIMLKGLARFSGEGAFTQAYACDLNLNGFMPGFNDIIPIIVNAATPGNKAMHTPRCRNLANG
ncbi:MCE family protein [Mycolicibacterium brumae]|uniref:Mammalian cell entry protein n=1 Tax=Mycolicibacterium brumae TaxID=85968 RepID=A0A2G5PDH1_9MYCO|nr:MCE family protein [Mycolicibacterium brumae]MCV7191827.1 MCE family protein [Mycolicibacterium brumae]PIB76381.1 mammalian cell entry protein [Mycolicibacterium brumae]UWW07133.1 MCE family protein [Mycolicibacterium brumae]